MMTENKSYEEQKTQRKIKSFSSWASVLGVLFRLVIILGLLLLILFLAVTLFTSIFPIWILVFPISVILFGIFIARIEYALHKRVKKRQPQQTKQEDAKDQQKDPVS